MISLDIIEREIVELEARGETTYAQCERLCWLYTVRDHLRPTKEENSYTKSLTGSEFLEIASGVDYHALMAILDEHMEALRIVQPKEYESVMAKIKQLR